MDICNSLDQSGRNFAKEKIPTGFILYVSIHVTFWKREHSRNEGQTSKASTLFWGIFENVWECFRYHTVWECIPDI